MNERVAVSHQHDDDWFASAYFQLFMADWRLSHRQTHEKLKLYII